LPSGASEGSRMVDGDVKIRSFREVAVLGGVEGAFEIVDFRANVDTTGEDLEKACGGSSAEKVGRPPRARLTLATVPFARKFFMRLAKVGRAAKDQRDGKRFAWIDAGNDGFDEISSSLERTMPVTRLP